MLLGPKGPLRCWFVGGTRVGAQQNTPHRAPPSVANTRTRRSSIRARRPVGLLVRIPVRPGVSPRAMVRRPYRPLRVRPIRALWPVWGAYAIRPGVSPPRVSPWAMVRRPYRPLRRPSIRAHGPVWGAYAIRPYRDRGTCIRVPSGTRPDSPASADARPYRGTCIRVPSGIRPASLPRQRPSADARAFLRSDRNKCTSSSCFCLRILVRLRGQRSIRKTCVSIRNITYFISPVHMAGMFILQAPYLLPISAVCFPRCSRNPRAVNNPSRRN